MISIPPSSEMNNDRLGRLIHSIGTDIEGELGFWQFTFSSARLVCITDEEHDRMRVMTPIVALDEMSQEQILSCLSANFDRALDARYCLNNDTLWGAFIHPLGSLTAELFQSACFQVSEVAHNFGDSYTSGGLSFNTDMF